MTVLLQIAFLEIPIIIITQIRTKNFKIKHIPRWRGHRLFYRLPLLYNFYGSVVAPPPDLFPEFIPLSSACWIAQANTFANNWEL